MDTVDTVDAWQVQEGDIVEIEGSTYRIMDIEDHGTWFAFTVETLDETDDPDPIAVDAHEAVSILGYKYED